LIAGRRAVVHDANLQVLLYSNIRADIRFSSFMKRNQTIFPEYVPPEGLSLLEIAVLLDNKLDYSDLSFQLYDFLLKGVLAFDGKKITLVAGNDETANLTEFEHDMFNILFEDMRIKEINLAEINSVSKNKLYAIRSLVYENLTDKGYYRKSPMEQRERSFYKVRGLLFLCSVYVQSVVVLFSVSTFEVYLKEGVFGFDRFTWVMLFVLFILVPVSLVILAYITAIRAERFAKKTPAGEAVITRVLGFKDFIVTAEKSRLDYLVKKEPDTYYQALPFAYLFGVIRKWLPDKENTQHVLYYQQFEDLDMYERGFEDSFTRANSIKWICHNLWINFLPEIIIRLNGKRK
jgi:hypothetical protein